MPHKRMWHVARYEQDCTRQVKTNSNSHYAMPNYIKKSNRVSEALPTFKVMFVVPTLLGKTFFTGRSEN